MADVTKLLAGPKALLERVFTVELDSSFPTWGVNITELIEQQLRPRNMRAFAASKEALPSIQVGIDNM
jgi:hypothetical protein